MNFEGSELLVRQAVPTAHRLTALEKTHAGPWNSVDLLQRQLRKMALGFRSLVEHCTSDDVPGRDVAAFDETTLDTLLRYRTPRDNAHALDQMKTILKADVRPFTALDVERLAERTEGGDP